MNRGKHICNTLKAIRLDIARANGIKYAPRECHHEGDCAGTCPACESEMRYLEREIVRRRTNGKAALVAGVSLSLASLTATSCNQLNNADNDKLQGEVELVEDSCAMADSTDDEKIESGEIVDTTDFHISEVVQTLGEVPVNVFGTSSHGNLDDECFRSVDNMPQFPGGEKALMKFLKDHIEYPAEAAKNNIQGRVIVQFVVEKTGKVGTVKVVRSVDENLDREAVRVVKLLPDFIPGSLDDGRKVNVWYTLPVNFLLPADNSDDE
mgnify:CR=1 FL=1